MKRIVIITGFFATVAGFTSCGGAKGNDPGSSYMPDMYYSRAYETYGYNNVEDEMDSLGKKGIMYSGMPVPGTVARGESLPYHINIADTAAFDGTKSPLDTVAGNPAQLKEAERLYLVNCGICHGAALDGNGPLYNNGNGPYAAAPANLKAPNIAAQTDGHYFHVITYGIRTMGSYGSQLTPEQRWWVIKFLRAKQTTGTVSTQGADSAQAVKPNEATGGVPVVQDSKPNNQ